MPDRLEVDPDVFRQLALQHELVEADTRRWAQQPTDWLKSFPDTYGPIADKVHQALVSYYDARERAGNALADEHKRTAENLRKSADAFEEAENEAASLIRNAGSEFGHDTPATPPPSSHAVTPPPGDSYAPPLGGPGGGPTDEHPDDNVTVPGGNDTEQIGAPNTNGPAAQTDNQATPSDQPSALGEEVPTGGGTPPVGAIPPADSAGSDNSSSSGAQSPGTSAPGTPLTGGMIPQSHTGSAVGDERAAAQQQAGAAAQGDGTSAPMAMPMATPFNAAVAAAKEKAAAPSYVVGGQLNDDLVLAKTLLGAVLAATDSPVGMSWAVSVMRGPGGAGVFITSNEGRGWLPAGLFLPADVSTPWVWDQLLGETGGSPWEGVADPARVLAEFGVAWGAKANAQMSALVSSGPIDPSLRAQLNTVAMEDMVGPAYEVDLRSPTPDTADRLTLANPGVSTESIARVPDSRVRARCLGLAADAHGQVTRSAHVTGEAMAARRVREQILTALQSGRPVRKEMWDELRDADDLLTATMLSRRVDVGRVDLGDVRQDNSASGLRDMVFERRCNELVLLLSGESSTQTLRDAVYAHGQIVDHPEFVAVPAAVSVADAPPVTAPSPASSGVSAPTAAPSGVSVTPPRGVIPPAVAPRPNSTVQGPDEGKVGE